MSSLVTTYATGPASATNSSQQVVHFDSFIQSQRADFQRFGNLLNIARAKVAGRDA